MLKSTYQIRKAQIARDTDQTKQLLTDTDQVLTLFNTSQDCTTRLAIHIDGAVLKLCAKLGFHIIKSTHHYYLFISTVNLRNWL